MANRHELLNNVITKLFKLSDKSKEKYNELLEKFKIRTLDQIQHFSDEKLQEFLNKINFIMTTGNKKMAKKLYTNKEFDKEVDSLFLRQAVKLAEETNENKKEPSKKEPSKEEPSKEETQEETQEEEKKIEEVVKDLQVAIIEKFNEVKTFKPGKSEAINFRNSVQKLIEISESAVKSVNEFYKKELGNTNEEEEV